MGCISSKNALAHASPDFYPTPQSKRRSRALAKQRSCFHSSSFVCGKSSFAPFDNADDLENQDSKNSENSIALTRGSSEKKNGTLTYKLGGLPEGEFVAACWPAWLSSVAGEAINGWLPLRAESFERLDKIGQGTYSDVYRARDIQTGKMVAIKKVKFDSFQPESVRFMAREILILRKLNHPNVMKLEGIITSEMSSNIYLVFEYMEHDLSGLLSSPDIRFTEAQIKCYMKQILSGVEHCHSHGILHRDIKTSNILVNNEGILKVADFGLANFMPPKNKQQLTSRVVTLWYRPPELLLGSTEYGTAVDLWSVGCVFAELFIGRAILKGRTEVEQLHKIFRLCGSPPDSYWKTSKLPLASMFKPQYPYESTLRERCKELPKTAVDLVETLLSIEPYKRESASSALNSKYFTTRPFACDPSSLPKYTPSKEIDAKFREEVRRRRVGAGAMAQPQARRLRKTLQDYIPPENAPEDNNVAHNSEANTNGTYYKRRGNVGAMQPHDTVIEASQLAQISKAPKPTTISVPAVQPLVPNNHAREKPEQPSSRTQRYIVEPPRLLRENEGSYLDEAAKPAFGDSFNRFEPEEAYINVGTGNKKKTNRVAFSGPVVYNSEDVVTYEDENENNHPNHRHHQVIRPRSRFYQG